jgi:hypothetical protein
MIGANINAYFKAAMNYPVERLVAVMQGKDNSIPQAAAMMALQIKKPMVDAAKGQEAMNRPQQPSVKEQMEQEVAMLPENVGIMNLPVEQEFADGGIVAFREGGSLTPEEQAELDRRRREQMSSFFGTLADIPSNVMNYGRRAYETVSKLPFESKTPLIKYGTQKRPGIFEYEQAPETLARMRKEELDTGGGGYKGQDFGAAGAATPVAELTSSPETPVTPRFVDARTTPPAAPGAGKGKGKGAAGPRKEEAPPPAPPSPFVPGEKGDLAAELTKYKALFPDVAKEYDTLKTETAEGYKKLAEERERTKPKDKAYEGLEKLLAKEEGAAKGKEARNLNMALVNAGLAIAGGRSQYALQNIAEGAQVGTKQYMAGLEKLEEAAKERRRQAATIEEARRAEARGDWKEAQQLNKEAFDAGMGIQRLKIEGVSKITGDTIKTATDRVNTQDQIAARDRQIVEQGRIELQKQTMSDIAAEKRARISADAYRAASGARLDPYNVAYDNATNRIKAEMQANPMLKADLMKNPQKYNEMFNTYLREALNKSVSGGVAPPPPGAGGGGARLIDIQ